MCVSDVPVLLRKGTTLTGTSGQGSLADNARTPAVTIRRKVVISHTVP